MNVITIVSAAGALTFLSMGVTRQVGLEGRLASMEEAASRARTDQPSSDILEMQARMDALVSQLASEPSGADAVEAAAGLRDEVSALQTQLDDARFALAAQRDELAAIEALARKADRIDEVQAGVENRWGGFTEALEAQAVLVKATRDELIGVRAQIAGSDDREFSPQDERQESGDAWTDMVGPTVQLAGDATVGSGVILKSQPVEGSEGKFQTLLLTSWHVVRDIRSDSVDEDQPIPVMLRDALGVKRHLTATLIAHDAPLDSALLRVDSTEEFPVGAALPTRERLKSARVFDSIVAVGCPLGNDPIPTRGHLSDLYHTVSSERFWMISAPTYIGNSGGGIFSGTSHELLGVFSKIYTHGAIRPTVIPHMGLVTPLEEFYDWIDGSQIAEVVESQGEATIVLR